MYFAWSDARKTEAQAMSQASPMAPVGQAALRFATRSASSAKVLPSEARAVGVFIMPGRMALALIPLPAYCMAIACVNWLTAALEAA